MSGGHLMAAEVEEVADSVDRRHGLCRLCGVQGWSRRPHALLRNLPHPSWDHGQCRRSGPIASGIVQEMDLPPPDKLLLGRLGWPDEVWPAVRMILETEYMTGQTIQINAGRYMT